MCVPLFSLGVCRSPEVDVLSLRATQALDVLHRMRFIVDSTIQSVERSVSVGFIRCLLACFLCVCLFVFMFVFVC